MKKIFMIMLAVAMSGSVHAAIWDEAFGLNPDNGENSEPYQDTLSAPTAVGSSDAGGSLFKSMLDNESDSGSLYDLEDAQ